jgi:hypothetical protein
MMKKVFKILFVFFGSITFSLFSLSQGISPQSPGSFGHCEDQCSAQMNVCRQQARVAERSGGGNLQFQCFNQARACQSKCGILKEGSFGENPHMEPCEKSIHKSRPYLAGIKDGLEEETAAPRRSGTISK